MVRMPCRCYISPVAARRCANCSTQCTQANTLANMAEMIVRRLEAGWAHAQELTEVKLL